MYIRVNTATRYRDIPTTPDDWHESDDADVAVALWAPTEGEGETPVLTAVPLDQFVLADYRYRGSKDFSVPGPLAEEGQLIMVGHEVFFVGLFSQHAGTARNLPIARFGHVSRTPIEPVRVRRADGTTEAIDGYLVEARSWGGHSGSPVFWYYPGVQIIYVPAPPGGPQAEPLNRAERRRQKSLPQPQNIPISREMGIIALLGLVSAHFDIPQAALTEGDVYGRIVTPLNAGMAVVTPAHKIAELLRSEDVATERNEYSGGQEEPPATFDVVHA
jgi:hypothetical protein